MQIEMKDTFVLNSRIMLEKSGIVNATQYFHNENSHFFNYNKVPELLSKLNQKYLDGFSRIIYIDPQDIYNYDLKYKTKSEIYLIVEKFKILNLEHKLFFCSGNLYNSYKLVKHLPVVTFISSCFSKPIDLHFDRDFEHRFLFLNRKPRLHRKDVYDFLKTNNLLSQCKYSYNSFDSSLPEHKKLEEDLKFMFPENTNPSSHITSKTFCSILTETHFYPVDQNAKRKLIDYGQVIFPTEKVDRVLMYGHPFIAVSNANFLLTLKKLGFKTFDKWWDESYDNELDDTLRMVKIKKLILDISRWSSEKCIEVFKEMIPTLEHNSKQRGVIRKIKDKHPVPDEWDTKLKDFIFLDNLIQDLN